MKQRYAQKSQALLASLIATSLCLTASAGGFSVLVTTDTPMPDGNGIITGLGVPILNNQAQVAFRVGISFPTNASFNAICTRDSADGVVFKLVRNYELLSGTTNRYESVGQADDDMALNNYGTVVSWADLDQTPGGIADDTGFFRSTIGSGLVNEVVREGGSFAGKTWAGFASTDAFALNNHNQAIVSADFTGPGVTSTNDVGVFLFRTNGSVTELVREGDPVPGGNGYFQTFAGLNLNDVGLASFVAGLGGTSNGSYDNLGVYVSDGTNVTEIERTQYSGGFDDLGSAAPINASGWVAFRARTSTNGIRSHIRVSDGAMTLHVADTGDSVTRITNKIGSINQYVEFNDQQQVLMATSMSPAGEALIRGRWLESGRTVVHTGEVLPGRTNVITGGLVSYNRALNERGQVAFLALLDNSSRRALLLHDDAYGLVEIAKVGDSLLGSTISDLAFNATSAFGHVPDERNGFNDFGGVAFWFALSNGINGIALWGAPPVGISSIQRQANDVIINFGTLGDRATLIETSTNLTGGFTLLSSNLYANGGAPLTTNFIHSGVLTNDPQRFYRMRLLLP